MTAETFNFKTGNNSVTEKLARIVRRRDSKVSCCVQSDKVSDTLELTFSFFNSYKHE
jgi:hypothetical protein